MRKVTKIAAAGNEVYQVSLPAGHIINTSVAQNTTSITTANSAPITIIGSFSTTIAMMVASISGGGVYNTCVGSGLYPLTNGGMFYKFTAIIPIN